MFLESLNVRLWSKYLFWICYQNIIIHIRTAAAAALNFSAGSINIIYIIIIINNNVLYLIYRSWREYKYVWIGPVRAVFLQQHSRNITQYTRSHLETTRTRQNGFRHQGQDRFDHRRSRRHRSGLRQRAAPTGPEGKSNRSQVSSSQQFLRLL